MIFQCVKYTYDKIVNKKENDVYATKRGIINL